MRLVQVYTPPTPSFSDIPQTYGSFTRAGGGAVVFDGLGFAPHLIHFQCRDLNSGNLNFSIAITNPSISFLLAIIDNGSGTITDAGYCLFIRRDPVNSIYGIVTDFGVDSFTITFTLTGSCQIRGHWVAFG